MDIETKKKLKQQFIKKQQDELLASIPMSIPELKEFLSYLNREDAPPCEHTLKESQNWIEKHNLSFEDIEPWLHNNGGYCDCEVSSNVYDAVGDIVGWHLEV